jgi:hypothetical protein
LDVREPSPSRKGDLTGFGHTTKALIRRQTLCSNRAKLGDRAASIRYHDEIATIHATEILAETVLQVADGDGHVDVAIMATFIGSREGAGLLKSGLSSFPCFRAA